MTSLMKRLTDRRAPNKFVDPWITDGYPPCSGSIFTQDPKPLNTFHNQSRNIQSNDVIIQERTVSVAHQNRIDSEQLYSSKTETFMSSPNRVSTQNFSREDMSSTTSPSSSYPAMSLSVTTACLAVERRGRCPPDSISSATTISSSSARSRIEAIDVVSLSEEDTSSQKETSSRSQQSCLSLVQNEATCRTVTSVNQHVSVTVDSSLTNSTPGQIDSGIKVNQPIVRENTNQPYTDSPRTSSLVSSTVLDQIPLGTTRSWLSDTGSRMQIEQPLGDDSIQPLVPIHDRLSKHTATSHDSMPDCLVAKKKYPNMESSKAVYTAKGTDETTLLLRTIQPKSNSSVGRIVEVMCCIVDELVNTERSYCHSLYVFSEVVAQTVCTQSGASLKDLRLLFPRSLPSLYSIHIQLLRQIEITTASPPIKSTEDVDFQLLLTPILLLAKTLECSAGCLSTKIVPTRPISVDDWNPLDDEFENKPMEITIFYAIYRRYLMEYTVAMKTMRRLNRQSSTFRQTLKELEQHEKCEGFDFSAFLLAPIQRLPRYLLLLKQLIKQIEKLNTLTESSTFFPATMTNLVKLIEERVHNILICLDEQLTTIVDRPELSNKRGKQIKRDIGSRRVGEVMFKPCTESPSKCEGRIQEKENEAWLEEPISVSDSQPDILNTSERVISKPVYHEHPEPTETFQTEIHQSILHSNRIGVNNIHLVDLESEDSGTRIIGHVLHDSMDTIRKPHASDRTTGQIQFQKTDHKAVECISMVTDSKTQTSPHVAWSRKLVESRSLPPADRAIPPTRIQRANTIPGPDTSDWSAKKTVFDADRNDQSVGLHTKQDEINYVTKDLNSNEKHKALDPYEEYRLIEENEHCRKLMRAKSDPCGVRLTDDLSYLGRQCESLSCKSSEVISGNRKSSSQPRTGGSWKFSIRRLFRRKATDRARCEHREHKLQWPKTNIYHSQAQNAFFRSENDISLTPSPPTLCEFGDSHVKQQSHFNNHPSYSQPIGKCDREPYWIDEPRLITDEDIDRFVFWDETGHPCFDI